MLFISSGRFTEFLNCFTDELQKSHTSCCHTWSGQSHYLHTDIFLACSFEQRQTSQAFITLQKFILNSSCAVAISYPACKANTFCTKNRPFYILDSVLIRRMCVRKCGLASLLRKAHQMLLFVRKFQNHSPCIAFCTIAKALTSSYGFLFQQS